MDYRAITNNSAEGFYKERGSKFYSQAVRCDTLQTVKDHLGSLKEAHPQATHICYAYRILGKDVVDEFSSDAGEPKGSSGLPILNMIRRQEVINTAVFVVRYYGGSKLGIPGLIHAYGAAAEEALQKCRKVDLVFRTRLKFSYAYDLGSAVEAALSEYQVEIINREYTDRVSAEVAVESGREENLVSRLRDISSGQILVKFLPENK